MDVEEFPCKFSRISKMADQYPDNDDEDEDGVSKIRKIGDIISTTDNEENGGPVASRLRGWQNSSRIFRVSRASGGKDRHSKVLTSKGLRDRRVRLSVSTAISFYDLQDRLGYDQPSKAVEWLIKAADEAINELPSLNTPFSDMPLKQYSSAGGENVGVEHDYRHYQQQISAACSSTSETSKGSGLSVSRSDANVRVNREKARERARERASKEKESETHLPNNNSSFTELLNAGLNKQNSAGGGGDCGGDGLSLFRKSEKQWQPPSMDYFTTGLLSSSRNSNLGFTSGQIQLGNNSNFPQSMMMIPPFSVTGENQNHHHNPPELQHFSFMPPNNGGGGGENENYNLNFTISPSSTTSSGFNNNRGTLQSNSSVPSSMLPHHHLQRFSSSIDGSSSNVVPFFMGAATSAHSSVSAAGHLESTNHQHYHQFGSGFDGSLQLYHGDGTRDSDNKGKGKN